VYSFGPVFHDLSKILCEIVLVIHSNFFFSHHLHSVTGKTVHRFVGEIFQKFHSSRFMQMLCKRSSFVETDR